MTVTKSMIGDEARRRMAVVHGTHYGSDITQKAVNTLILHVVFPSRQTLHALHYHLAVLTASNKLEASLPDDFAADHHWPVPPMPQLDADAPSTSAGTVAPYDQSSIEELRRELGNLRTEFENHDHVPEPINGQEVKWSDFALRKDVEALFANLKG